MNNRTLGTIGMLAAPFLLIDTVIGDFNPYRHSSLTGLFGLVYMIGWMCSLVALKRSGAFGTGAFGKIIFSIQTFFLILGNWWNIYELLQPGAGTMLYNVLDIFWPISNLFMLVTGITIAVKGNLRGWKRYVPLLVGCWAPLGIICWIVFSRTPAMLLFINLYSTVTWFLMGLGVVLHERESNKVRRTSAQKHLHRQYSTLS